ncbi:MAG: radical SAM protein [Candidatus Schekmanbacteria bacterium]|nr:MAG: radical SAM protein [Candidatus Schekmanbacteria bacterium]
MENDLTFYEAVQKYPAFPKFTILKIDLYRRGVLYSDRVIEEFGRYPGPFILKDGTSVMTAAGECMPDDHYTIDFHNGKLGIFYKGEFVEETEFCPRPRFFGETTSSGIPMEKIGMFRPQVLNIWTDRYCHFWEKGNQCKFCSINALFKERKQLDKGIYEAEDIRETIKEAMKEPGRFSMITVTGGANPNGKEPFDDEVARYIEVIQAIGDNFESPRIPLQLTSCAFSKKQVKKIYDETKAMMYCPDIEVWDRNLFAEICPGKAKYVGWDNWVKSLIDAVGIFGKGLVATNIVLGVELAADNGFSTEDEALKSNLEGCEFLAKRGVAMMGLVWRPVKGSAFYKRRQPSLEYYIRVSQGLHDIRVSYGLHCEFDDYKHCGNHGDGDLHRID